MGWLQDELAQWAKIAEATKVFLDLPEMDLTEPEEEETDDNNLEHGKKTCFYL